MEKGRLYRSSTSAASMECSKAEYEAPPLSVEMPARACYTRRSPVEETCRCPREMHRSDFPKRLLTLSEHGSMPERHGPKRKLLSHGTTISNRTCGHSGRYEGSMATLIPLSSPNRRQTGER